MEQGLLAFVMSWIEDGIHFLIWVFVDMFGGDFFLWLVLLCLLAGAYLTWRKITRQR